MRLAISPSTMCWPFRWATGVGSGWTKTATAFETPGLSSVRMTSTYFSLASPHQSPTDPRIELRGTVSHDWQVRRSGYIADRLYSVSTDDIIVSDIAEPSVPITTLVFGATMDAGELAPPRPVADQTATPLDDNPLRGIVSTASAHMAEQLHIEPRQIALVTAEAELLPMLARMRARAPAVVRRRHPPTNSCFRQRVPGICTTRHEAGDVQLVSADFDFAATLTPRHNATNPLDANDDGHISPIDALLVINVLNEMAAKTDRTAPLRAVDSLVEQSRSEFYTDVNGDGFVAPIDALWVINRLNSPPPAVAAIAPADTTSSADFHQQRATDLQGTPCGTPGPLLFRTWSVDR